MLSLLKSNYETATTKFIKLNKVIKKNLFRIALKRQKIQTQNKYPLKIINNLTEALLTCALLTYKW